MKKIFLYWLIVYFGMGNIFLLQVIKFPDLNNHYQLHFQSDALTLFEFLNLHYNTREDETDKDLAADNALPFKSSVSGEKPFNSSPPENRQEVVLHTPAQLLLFAKVTKDGGQQLQSEIFQPPRC
ncbi:MAG: hypothetical protein IPM91_13230 [Bacteroidetes bacterium]|nr:hypothetical protein [Bacteroidota bacterium]